MLDHVLPARRGMDVDLDHAWVRRDLDDVDARIDRWRIALDVHGEPGLAGRLLDRGDEGGEIERIAERRQEHAQLTVARLDRERGAHGAVDLARPVLRRAPEPAAPRCRAAAAPARRAPAAGRDHRTGRAAARADNRPRAALAIDPIGKRKPAGASPGIRNSLSRRMPQRSVTQRRPRSGECQTWTGST